MSWECIKPWHTWPLQVHSLTGFCLEVLPLCQASKCCGNAIRVEMKHFILMNCAFHSHDESSWMGLMQKADLAVWVALLSKRMLQQSTYCWRHDFCQTLADVYIICCIMEDNVLTLNNVQMCASRTLFTCTVCMLHRVKFGAFYEYLDSLEEHNFDRIASGHYARIIRSDDPDDPVQLALAPDAVKDQTYFLAHLTQAQLSRVMFPLGHFNKVLSLILLTVPWHIKCSFWSDYNMITTMLDNNVQLSWHQMLSRTRPNSLHTFIKQDCLLSCLFKVTSITYLSVWSLPDTFKPTRVMIFSGHANKVLFWLKLCWRISLKHSRLSSLYISPNSSVSAGISIVGRSESDSTGSQLAKSGKAR